MLKTGRINIIKLAILSKAIYRFNAIPIKIPTQFFVELEPFPNLSGITKPQDSENILHNKRSWGITILDLKLYYKGSKKSSGKKTTFLSNGTGSTRGQHAEKCKLTHSYLLVQS